MSLRPSDDAEPPQITSALRLFYDADADHRDKMIKQDWKLDERAAFLDRLRAARAATLLEVGAGTGQDSVFFASEGLEVTAIDLSPAMIERIRAKGIRSRVQDVRDLRPADGPFDAVYAFNSLLHVPNADLAAALTAIRSVLTPGGLFYLGVYSGDEPEEGSRTTSGSSRSAPITTFLRTRRSSSTSSTSTSSTTEICGFSR